MPTADRCQDRDVDIILICLVCTHEQSMAWKCRC